MTQNYIQPAVEIANIESMTLMQAASPAGGGPAEGNYDHMNIGSDDQW